MTFKDEINLDRSILPQIRLSGSEQAWRIPRDIEKYGFKNMVRVTGAVTKLQLPYTSVLHNRMLTIVNYAGDDVEIMNPILNVQKYRIKANSSVTLVEVGTYGNITNGQAMYWIVGDFDGKYSPIGGLDTYFDLN